MSSGKSTVMYHAISEFQKKYPDEDVALIDVEFSLDLNYLKNLGINLEQLIICQPESGDQALNVARALVNNGVKLIVVDSVAALVPAAELAGEIGDAGIGQQARLMSQTMRILNTEAGKKGCTILWTNQIRDKIGGFGWGPKTTTSGGKALGFYSSVRLEIVRMGSVKEKVDGVEIPVSNNVKVTVTKNKTFSPYRVAEFTITFGYGIDRLAGLFGRAIKYGVIEKRGSWFSAFREQIGQGRLNALDMLRNSPEFVQKIEDETKKCISEGKNPSKTDKGVLRVPVGDDNDETDDSTVVEDV
jgi:recombination protein RecA